MIEKRLEEARSAHTSGKSVAGRGNPLRGEGRPVPAR